MTTLTIPCTLMRAGTSRGPFFLRDWLPADAETLEQALIGAIGASDPLQLDGLGGGSSLNSKVAIVSRSKEPGCDLDYLFAQVGVGNRSVDMRPNCGNMLSGVVPFAIEQGLIVPAGDRTTARVFNVNTGAKIDVTVCTPNAQLTYDGTARIDGVAGTAAPVLLSFLDCWGAVTGKLFPTGQRIDIIDGTEVTCIDAAMPLMIVRAAALGITGCERPAELDANAAMLVRIERLRRSAGERMGLGDVSASVVPKPVLLSEGDDAHSITSRYFTPFRCHSSHAVTGAIGVATAFALPATVASGVARTAGTHTLAVLHPEGRIEVEVEMRGSSDDVQVERAALLRTARRIMHGEITLPGYVFSGGGVAKTGDVPSARPARPRATEMQIIVPTSAGGANDAVARLLARELATLHGAPTHVDNRAGSNGTIACNFVKAAPSDGRTLLLGYTATHGIQPAWEDVGYDPIRDFAPVGIVCWSPTVLVVADSSPLRSLDQAIETMRRSPGALRYAASGHGTLPQFAAELFARAVQAPVDASFFDGSGPALAETMRGRADFMFASLHAALPHLRSGNLRALAVAQSGGDASLPGIPALSDAGFAGLDLVQWYGLFAPAQTSTEVIDALNRDLNRILGQQHIVGQLKSDGARVASGTPDALRDLLVAEAKRWRENLAMLGIPALAEAME